MSVIKHKKVSAIPDGLNPSLIQPSDWNEEHTISPPVQGIIYDPDGDGNFSSLQGVGLLQDKVGDGVITHVRVQGLLNDKVGDGNIVGTVVKGLHYDAVGDSNITGLQVTGLLQDVAGDGTISGVVGPGVPIKAGSGQPYVGVAASLENQYLRRKITGGPVEYEFGVIPPAPGFEPNVVGLLLDKLGNNVFTGVNVTGFPHNPNGDNNYVGVSAAGEGHVLRRKWNSASTAYEFIGLSYLISTDLDFRLFIPVNLVVGSNVLSLVGAFTPAGINGSSPGKHYVRVGDATGGSEIVMITAFSDSPRSITFTCTLPHTAGNWTLMSATSGIQECIHHAYGKRGIYIKIPNGHHLVWGTIYITNTYGTAVTLEGDGNKGTVLIRGTGFINTYMINYDSGVFDTECILSNFTLFPGQTDQVGTVVNSTFTIIASGKNFLASNMDIENGVGGFNLIDLTNARINNCAFFQTTPYSAFTSSISGVALNGNCNEIFISDCTFTGEDITSANFLYAGILINGGSGVFISNNTFSAQYGISIEAVGSALAHIHISDNSLNLIKITGISIINLNAPAAYSNIRITNNRITGNAVGFTTGNGISITGDCDYVHIGGNLIFAFGIHGVFINGINSYQGVARNSIIITGNQIHSNNLSGDASGSGVRVIAAGKNISIIGNSVSNRAGFGDTRNGIFSSSAEGYIITDNSFRGLSNPIAIGTFGPNIIIKDNLGVDDIIPTVASAAMVSLPMNPMVIITGTIPILNLLTYWEGRQVILFFVDAAPGGVAPGGVAGGAFWRTRTVVSRETLSLFNHGNDWY